MANKPDLELIRERVKSRIGLGSTPVWQNWRDMAHGTDKIAKGDWSALGIMPPQESQVYGGNETENVDTRFRPIQLMDAIEGRPNHMLRALWNIIMGLSTTEMAYRIDSTDRQYSEFMSAFLNKTLGPRPFGCDFQDVRRLVTWDALSYGIGWFILVMRDGKPEIARGNALKIIWDLNTGPVSSAQWIIIEDEMRLSAWKRLFPNAECFKNRDGAMDPYLRGMFYYDVTDADNPIFSVYLAGSDTGANAEELELKVGDDYPYFQRYEIADNNYKYPYLPASPLVYHQAPNTLFPDSVAFRMVPHQRAILEASAAEAKRVRLTPKRLLNIDALNERTKTEIMSGRDPDTYYVERDLGNAMTVVEGVPIDATLAAYKAEAERMITAMSGEDPFTSGANNDRNFDKATQVTAVQSASQVSSVFRAEITAHATSSIVQKYLWMAADYWQLPIRVRVGDHDLDFDNDEPLSAYIDPGASVTVAKDDLVYMSSAERMAMQERLMNLSASIGNQAGVMKAYEEFLGAAGIDDVGAWLSSGETSIMASQDGAGGEPVQQV